MSDFYLITFHSKFQDVNHITQRQITRLVDSFTNWDGINKLGTDQTTNIFNAINNQSAVLSNNQSHNHSNTEKTESTFDYMLSNLNSMLKLKGIDEKKTRELNHKPKLEIMRDIDEFRNANQLVNSWILAHSSEGLSINLRLNDLFVERMSQGNCFKCIIALQMVLIIGEGQDLFGKVNSLETQISQLKKSSNNTPSTSEFIYTFQQLMKELIVLGTNKTESTFINHLLAAFEHDQRFQNEIGRIRRNVTQYNTLAKVIAEIRLIDNTTGATVGRQVELINHSSIAMWRRKCG